MPNHSFSSAKELLTAAYARNWRTATQTLPLIEQYETERSREWSPQLVWGWWRLEDFPTSPENTWGQRYDYIDQYLKKLLGAQPHPTRPHHNLRPDLNGASGTVRAWLMHKVLQHMIKHKDL